MAVWQLSRKGGEVHLSRAGQSGVQGRYPSVVLHGCDTTIPGRGKLLVEGVQSKWTDDDGKLHLSDDKRAQNGLGGFEGFL